MLRCIRAALWVGFFGAAAALALVSMRAAGGNAPALLHALLIGGGPNEENNTAEIEAHVRFVASLLKGNAATRTTLLFADGNARHVTVSYADSASLGAGQRALDVLLPKDDFGAPTRTRAPELEVSINGAALRQPIRRAFKDLASNVSAGRGTPPQPVLVYVAGHGTRNEKDEENSAYELWKDESLSVRDLAAELARLPARTPVTLVMAQCYSGAFANVIFRRGDPKEEGLVDLDLAGFFSAAADREAAGCGSDVGAADFQDFSSYFFGALGARDRLGAPISGADFDGDGRVSLHEAFCYALIHDESIDTPICTSQIFLRRFVSLSEAEIYSTPFAQILRDATAAERAALEALSERLELRGDKRALAAYDRLSFTEPIGRPAQLTHLRFAKEKLSALRAETLDAFFAHWPALRWKDSSEYDAAVAGALRELDTDRALCHRLFDARDEVERADKALDVEEAHLLRFTALCDAVVRAGRLRSSGNDLIKARFERLRQAEMRRLPLLGQ